MANRTEVLPESLLSHYCKSVPVRWFHYLVHGDRPDISKIAVRAAEWKPRLSQLTLGGSTAQGWGPRAPEATLGSRRWELPSSWGSWEKVSHDGLRVINCKKASPRSFALEICHRPTSCFPSRRKTIQPVEREKWHSHFLTALGEALPLP